MRCLRRVVRFDPATICLALTFVFLSAAGAVAQTAPVPLVADAGPDQSTVVSGTEVQLDGTGSTESESDGSRSVTYLWTRASGSAGGTGSPVTLSDTRVLQPTFTAPTLILGADSETRGADSVTYIFTLTVTDDQGSAQATDMVTITVTARPVAVTGFDQKVPPGWPVVLDGFRSAAPAGRAIIKYTWFSVEVAPECDEAPKHTIEGSQARFTAEDLAPGAADVTYCFFLQVEQSNGNKSSVVGPLKVTVTNRESPYVPPVAMITGGDRVVASGGTVTLDGRHSTIDYRTWGRYRWERTDGTSTATGILTGETFRTASFTAETRDAGAPDVTHIFTLTVTDYQGGSSTATVTITVTAALVANAGPDQEFHSSGTVTLDGSGSTASGGGRNVTYAWTRASGSAGGTGSAVNLSDTTVVDPTFTTQTLNPGDVHVTYIFTLTVTDSANETDTDTVTITVFSVPANPVAQAGDDVSVGSGRTVTLDGSRSTVDYRRDRSTLAGKLTGSPPLFYSWARTGGTSTATGTLTGEDTATPRFTAETLTDGAEDVTHILTLTVTDGLAVTATDTVTITVTSALVANAGTDQDNVASGATVQLDGSGSTASGGGKNVTYAWTQTGGATVTLSNTTVLDPTFTAQTLNPGDASVTYIFTLTVTDSANESDTDTVTITVLAPLVAEAGPDKTVASGGTVTLDGSGSTETVGVRNVVYAWARTGGTGDDTVAPSNPVALQTSFTAEVLTPGAAPVIHEFTLTVADNQGSTQATDTVLITVTAPAFDALVAHAGADKSVTSEGEVTLDGSGSTVSAGVRTVSYAWTRTVGTGGTLADADKATARFTAPALNPGDAPVIHTFELRVTDNQGSAAVTDTVLITVTAPAFDALVAHAGADKSVTSEGEVTLDGSGSTVSAGVRTVSYAWTRTVGTGGTLADADKATARFTAPALNPGDAPVIHTFELRVTDNQGSAAVTDTVLITVTAPAFDALVAHAGADKSVTSEGEVTLDGSGSTVSAGVRTVSYAWTQTVGTGGTLADADKATARFTAPALNPGDAPVIHTFELRVTDNQGSAAVTDTVLITVTAPAFDALVAHAGADKSVTSEGEVTLDGSGSTVSAGVRTVSYAWTRTVGTGGTLADADKATARFTAPALNPGDAPVIHTFELRVTDNQGSAAVTDTVLITVTAPAFDALVAHAGADKSVTSEGEVTLDGSGSTVSAGVRTVSYAWTRTVGTGGTLADADKATARFTAPALNPGDAPVIHTFELRVTDNQGSAAVTDTVLITVTAPAFDALVAHAGADKSVTSEGEVTLDGSGSTVSAGVRTVSYAWTRTVGTGGTLADADKATARFTAPALNPGDAPVIHTFELRVTDNQGSAAVTDTVLITVTAPAFDALVAHAGADKSVTSEGEVTLDGSGSTVSAGVRTVSYAWTQTVGTGGTLADADKATARFTAPALNPGDAPVIHTFELRVTDNQGSAAVTDTVLITVTAPAFDALVAHAGADKSVTSEGEVTLDGSGSTVSAGVRTVSYAWTRTVGTGGTLADADKATARFTAPALNPGDAPVIHTFELRVTDNQGSAAVTDTVLITVTAPAFDALVAHAGADKSVTSEGEVTLDGSGSTVSAGVRTVSYAWTRTVGTGGTLADADKATARFTAPALNPGDAPVIHTFELRVTDNQGSAAVTDTVLITVTAPAFDALVAHAGADKSVTSEGEVTLDGSGSTVSAGVRTVSYAWTRTVGTGGTLAGENTATPTFTAHTLTPGAAPVIHTFELRVTDNQGSAAVTDTVLITVTAPAFDALVAHAGADKSVTSEGEVTLDGSGSTVSAGVRTVSYAWTRTVGTGGTLTGENTATPTFTAHTLTPGAAPVIHEFTLTVTDDQNTPEATDTVEVTVTAPPFDALVAEAGPAKSVVSGGTVTLDGSGSETDSTRTVTYAWTRTGGDGATVTLTDADTLRPTFTAQTLTPGAGSVTYIFTLTVTVTDDQSSAAATDTVTITAVPVDILDSPFELIGVSPLLFGLIVSAVDILVSTSELTVQEGGSSAYQVRLSESPGQDVIVTAVSDNENVVLENERLLFNAHNWDAWQEIRIGTVAGFENADGKTLIEHRLDVGGVALRQSGVVNVTVREEDPVLRPVGENLTARATTLLNNLPNLSSFLKQDRTTPGGSGGFTFKATNGHLILDGGFVRDGVWGEIAGSYTRSESGDTRFVLGSFGIHRKYSERFLAGAMLQIDLADHDLDGKSGSIDGTGWLAGPYFAARHGTWPLYFEGRLLYGQSDNDIRFNDSELGETMRVGSFDTTRMLAQLRLEGEIALSDRDEGPRLIPYADTHWFEDRAAAFTDSIGTRISGQTVSIRQLELGSNVEVPIAMSHGAMTFTGGLGVVYSNTEGDYIPSVSRSRGRGEIGFSYGLDDNVRIDFESFYDGIGTSGYEGYGLSLNAEIKF